MAGRGPDVRCMAGSAENLGLPPGLWPISLIEVILGSASGTAAAIVGLMAARGSDTAIVGRVPEGNRMSIRIERLRIGPYQLVRQLERGPRAERWLAFNEVDQTAHVAYRFRMGPD